MSDAHLPQSNTQSVIKSNPAEVSLAFLILGLVATALVWLIVPDFWILVPAATIPQAVAIFFGVRGWRSTLGKVTTVAAGVLLTAWLAFFSLVLLIVVSGLMGAPM